MILAGLPVTAATEKKPLPKAETNSEKATSKPKSPSTTGTKADPKAEKKPVAGGPKEKKPATEAPKTELPTEGSSAGKSPHGRPALIATTDLLDFETLPEDRRKLIEGAITVARESPWLPYKFGGSSPAEGGFDCSGAMYFAMGKAGLKPPRTSADQYLWLKESNRLHEVPEGVQSIDHPGMTALKPGDLLFWSGTYAPTDGRVANITHVAMYLGREKKDKRPVMINATDGRSYRGTQANGYGVYDFYLPKAGGKSKFVGYGTPLGIAEIIPPPAGETPAP